MRYNKRERTVIFLSRMTGGRNMGSPVPRRYSRWTRSGKRRRWKNEVPYLPAIHWQNWLLLFPGFMLFLQPFLIPLWTNSRVSTEVEASLALKSGPIHLTGKAPSKVQCHFSLPSESIRMIRPLFRLTIPFTTS